MMIVLLRILILLRSLLHPLQMAMMRVHLPPLLVIIKRMMILLQILLPLGLFGLIRLWSQQVIGLVILQM